MRMEETTHYTQQSTAQNVAGQAELAKFIGWNPLSLISYPGRMEAISYEFRQQYGLLCPGTHVRQKHNLAHHREDTQNHFWVHWGWGRSPHTNSSCGCAIAINRRRFHPRHLTRIGSPPAPLQGRGGSVDITRWHFRVRLIVGYLPPIPHNANAKMTEPIFLRRWK